MSKSDNNKKTIAGRREELLRVLSFQPISDKKLTREKYATDYETRQEEKANQLEGWAKKEFLRVKGLSDIVMLEKSKPNSYVTYVDDIIEEDMVPESISVLVKYRLKDNVYPEVLTSQLLNYFGVPTVLNIPVKAANGTIQLYSVDCISYGERFKTFMDKGIFTQSLSDANFSGFDKLDNLTEDNKKQLIRDYILTHLVRYCLLADFDLDSYNIGLVHDLKKGVWRLVNFDYESTFWEKELDDYEIKPLKQMIQMYPDIFEEFLEKLKELSKVFDEAIKMASEKYREHLEILKKNSLDVIKNIERILLEQTM